MPFTSLTVKGATITATLTADGRTIRLEATVDEDTIAGGWSSDGDDDRWTFEGTRQVPPAARRSGRFDVVLEAAESATPPNYVPGPSDLALPPASGAPIAIAIREQLGLMLEPETGSIPVVVVDHAAHPDAP